MIEKIISIALAMISAAAIASAKDYHVGAEHSLKSISAAAELAQPGDTIMVHEGIYREEINPPRGGLSGTQRIIYTAAPGAKVVIKGSEPVRCWTRVQNDTWKVTLSNSFFGDFNPYADPICGDWFNGKGRTHHTGAVYFDGHWLKEAPSKEMVLKPAGTTLKSNAKPRADLLNIAWLQPGGNPACKVMATSATGRKGAKDVPGGELGQVVGNIKNGNWLEFEGVDCGSESYELAFHVASVGSSQLEIRKDNIDGAVLGSAIIPDTGGWNQWKTVKVGIDVLTGVNNFAVVFTNDDTTNAEEVLDYKGLYQSCLWFGEVDDKNTTIYAQFKDLDPNERDTEINVRRTVFYPRKPGRNYITVRGFTMMHAATPWAPPTAEQVGLIGTHWSKGWIIENNTISHSKCVGITLGKYGDEWDNRSATATAYNDTIERALKNSWNKETVGSHLVRNNTVSHCEQAGIVGSLGCVFSTLEGNEFQHIHTHKLFSGAETAAIKFHAPIDMIIKDNLVRQCGGYGLLWLDWMAQGTRVSGNLFYNNFDENVFMEVNHGPYLFDNNIFIGSDFKNWSQGGAYCYNILPGAITVSPQKRETPYHRPHTTEVLALSSISGGDDRYFNNLMTQSDPFGSIKKTITNMVVEGNQPMQSAKILEKDDGVYLSFELPETEHTQPVTAGRLGKTLVSQTTFANPDGTPMTLATDYFGKPRDPRHPGAGPFAGLKPGRHEIKVWPKQ
ncbi:MAG: Arabinoxylan arabinofuranohydrolase precursor [Verrucomicrobiota bacterium]